MGPLKCCLCLKPSNEVPDYFKTVLGGFIQLINKLQSPILNGIKSDKLTLCKCCWIYFMRIHQLEYEVHLKDQVCDAKKVFLSSQIRQSQRSLVEKGSNPANWEDLELQSAGSQDNDDDDSNVIGFSLDEDSAEAVSCSLNSTNESDNESLKSFETTKMTTTDSDRPASAISPNTKQTEATSDDRTDGESKSEPTRPVHNVTNCASSEEKVLTEVTSSHRSDSDSEAVPTEVSSDDTSESDSEQKPAKPVKSMFTYENKWLPKNIKLPKFSYIVKQVSETDFLFMDKYPFQGTEFGFKCGLCRVVSTFTAFERQSPWENLVKHIKKWHMGDQDASKIKNTTQRCIQVGPDSFQYGKYLIEKVDGMYQCGECGALKKPTRSGVDSVKNILHHIVYHHEKMPKEYICEYCGVVYNNRVSLRYHKLTKHESHEGPFPCSECGKNFVSRSSAVSHQNRVHFKRRDFICEGCGKRFSQKTELETHVASVHRGEKLKCAECGKMFGSQTALNVHRYCHSGKKYSCQICGMDFTQAYSVTRHKKTAHPE